MATTPIKGASVYGDFAGLEKLKSGARHSDPAAVRQVARQFESLFARMMIKSMRDAVGRDPIFGSDQAQTYQGMFDDQLSLELTKGRGLGLADMLMRQLQHSGGGTAAQSAAPTGMTTTAAHALPASSAEQASFVQQVMPQAKQAAQQLGVDPVAVVAQAALETNWGRSVPCGSNGQSSNNLFGIKAGNSWSGPSVTARTQEYSAGNFGSLSDSFRAYSDPGQCFQDYVALLRNNPRFQGALDSGGNVQAFASALQQGGYATDPNYAHKVTAVASQVAAAMQQTPGGNEESLKFSAASPLTASGPQER
jgi:peptidoglycan hydrolase FlgJ